jgi:hypothetical protein
VGARADVGNNSTYSVKPLTNYKGLLQANDKVVLYQVIGDYYSYTTGPYVAASVSFSKAELEAGTAKTLTVVKNGTGANYKYLYVQAYLEHADGTKECFNQWGNLYWDYNSSSIIDYKNTHSGQHHAQLDY